MICLDDLQQGDTIARLPCLCIYHKPYVVYVNSYGLSQDLLLWLMYIMHVMYGRLLVWLQRCSSNSCLNDLFRLTADSFLINDLVSWGMAVHIATCFRAYSNGVVAKKISTICYVKCDVLVHVITMDFRSPGFEKALQKKYILSHVNHLTWSKHYEHYLILFVLKSSYMYRLKIFLKKSAPFLICWTRTCSGIYWQRFCVTLP